LKEELQESRKQIEKETGNNCLHFCYPNGNCDEISIKAVKEAGYLSAVCCNIGTNYLGTDLFRIKRLPFPQLKRPEHIKYWLAMTMLMEFFSSKNAHDAEE